MKHLDWFHSWTRRFVIIFLVQHIIMGSNVLLESSMVKEHYGIMVQQYLDQQASQGIFFWHCLLQNFQRLIDDGCQCWGLVDLSISIAYLNIQSHRLASLSLSGHRQNILVHWSAFSTKQSTQTRTSHLQFDLYHTCSWNEFCWLGIF